jgi:hypothetical protein
MNRDIENIVDRCLDLLQEGRSIEQCLHLYPEVADDLEPLLRVAGELQRLPEAEPRPAALRTALLRAGAALPSQSDVLDFNQDLGLRSSVRRSPVRIAFRWAAAAAAVLVLTLGLGTASANSVPGDFLYPIKLATERVTFALTTSTDRRAELHLSFADSRLEELVRTAQADGQIDPLLLKRLLEHATLALEDAKPLPDERYRQLLTRVDAFNTYQKQVFEQLQPAVHSDDRQLLTRAISVCDERERWMRRTWGDVQETPPNQVLGPADQRPTQPPERDRCWDSGCDW